jgi:hypothetical protein
VFFEANMGISGGFLQPSVSSRIYPAIFAI